MRRFRAVLVGLFCCGLLALNGPACAQSTRPIRLVVPFGPGGGQDILARSFNNELSVALGQPVIVDYRPGAGGAIGTAAVAKAEPDGLTFIVSASSHIISVLLSAKPLYDPIKDFSAVAHIGPVSQVLLINARIPAKTVDEFVRLAKANPGKFNYASAGHGSSTHLAMAYFAALAGLDMVHIPTKSNAEAVNEMLGGRVEAVSLPSVSALQYLRDNRVNVLGVSSREPSALLPGLPVVTASVQGYVWESWYGLLAPAGTPRAVIGRVNGAMEKLLKDPVIIERLARLGVEPRPMSPEAFDQFLAAEFDRFTRIVKLTGAAVN